MADDDAELHAVDFEEAARVAGHVEPILGRIELVLRLLPEHFAVAVENDRGDLLFPVGEKLHPHDRRHAVFGGELRHRFHGFTLHAEIVRERLEVLPPQSG